MKDFDYRKYLAEGRLYEESIPSGWKKIDTSNDYEKEDKQGRLMGFEAPMNGIEGDEVDNIYIEQDGNEFEVHIMTAFNNPEYKGPFNSKEEALKVAIQKMEDLKKDWDEKDLAEGKLLNEAELTDDLVQRVAQAIADEFTAEDRELDLKYVITPNSIEAYPDGGGFDLDVNAGPNTPGDDWEDSRGFGIANYLGDYAGGSFVIRPEGDGYLVTNAASRNAKVAYITPEGEIEIISAEDSKADLGMTDDVETDYMERRKEMSDYMEEGEEEIKEIKSNKMKKSELKEMIKAAMMAETQVEETAVYEAEEDEVEDVELEDTEDIEVDSEPTADVEVSGEKKEVQDSLEAALEAAKAMGDQKLVDQIGNSITFFTRTHVVGSGEVAEGEIDLEVNNPAEEAEVGMELEEIARMKKIAGIK